MLDSTITIQELYLLVDLVTRLSRLTRLLLAPRKSAGLLPRGGTLAALELIDNATPVLAYNTSPAINQ
jgi:hypothetical protein